jgi:hypothetical protein
MGDTSQGTVLRGQVQGVKRGVGVSISANGAISVDPSTITGVVKLNNTDAFNGYVWPNGVGLANQVLTTDAEGVLRWDDVSDDFFKNVFTTKGQLIVGTGVKTYTLQNVGFDTSFLVADSTTPSGLVYTSDLTSAVLLPVGTSAERDCYCVPDATALTGQFRYSTTFDTLEFYNGVKWVQVAASDISIETYVKQTVPLVGTPSAVIRGGSTGDRQNAPLAGYFRYNTTLLLMEFYNGTKWVQIFSDDILTQSYVRQTQPPVGSPSAVIVGGSTNDRQLNPQAGYFRFNSSLALMEFYDGAKWVQIASSDILTETYVKQTVPAFGTPSAVIPGGPTTQRQDNPQSGYLRYNTTLGVLEFYNTTEWRTFVYDIDGGTTGLVFTGIPDPDAGVIQVSGTLGLANGGTGATTQPGAANNILPPQLGNTGEYLVTDGSNSSWQSVANSLVGGMGIEVDPGPGPGQATISFTGGRAIYFPPEYIVPAQNVAFGSPSGLGAYTTSLGPYEVVYPAGAQYATIQTRTRLDVTAIAGADYSGTGFIYVTDPKVSIQVSGEATPGTGTFTESLAGVVGGYASNQVFPAGLFLIRTDEINLSNPAGGSFFLTIQYSQVASGPNSVTFGLPQFYVQPFVNT